MTALVRFMLILALVAVPFLSGFQGADGIATAQGWNNLAPWAAGTAFRQDVPGKKLSVNDRVPYTGPTLSPSVFAVGDVFAGVSPNWVVQLSSTGVIKDTLRATGHSGEMTGSYFSKTGSVLDGVLRQQDLSVARPGAPAHRVGVCEHGRREQQRVDRPGYNHIV